MNLFFTYTVNDIEFKLYDVLLKCITTTPCWPPTKLYLTDPFFYKFVLSLNIMEREKGEGKEEGVVLDVQT